MEDWSYGSTSSNQSKGPTYKIVDTKRTPKFSSSTDMLLKSRKTLWNVGLPEDHNEPATANAPDEDRTHAQTPQPARTAAEIACYQLRVEPVHCPLASCGKLVCMSSIFTHFAEKHSSAHEVPQAYQGKSTEILLNVSKLPHRKVLCLGLLSYTGKTPESEHDISLQPAKTGICLPNTFLVPSLAHLKFTMPIIVMCLKASWTEVVPPHKISAHVVENHKPDLDILFIWVCSSPTTKPMHCSLTLFDSNRSFSRSSSLKVRSIMAPMTPWEIFEEHDSRLMINHVDLKQMSVDDTNYHHLEVIVNEYK